MEISGLLATTPLRGGAEQLCGPGAARGDTKRMLEPLPGEQKAQLSQIRAGFAYFIPV